MVHRTRTASDYRRGQRAECELCQEVSQCFDRFGLLTCEACQAEFLPSRGFLL